MAKEDIFVNVNADSLADARVISQTNNTQKPFQKFVAGDLRNLCLYFTDGSGNYVDVSSYSSVRVGVGVSVLSRCDLRAISVLTGEVSMFGSASVSSGGERPV